MPFKVESSEEGAQESRFQKVGILIQLCCVVCHVTSFPFPYEAFGKIYVTYYKFWKWALRELSETKC